MLPRSGKALAVADGEGRNGVWLAEQGLDVLSIDFSPSAQRKAEALAMERGVTIAFVRADVAFHSGGRDFTQFSAPLDRAKKWQGCERRSSPAGPLILQGYTPKQLQYGTGGPKQVENVYTRAMFEDAFRDFRNMTMVEEEVGIYEGTSHGGMSAVINFTARK